MAVYKYKDGYAFRVRIPSDTLKRSQKFMSGFKTEKQAYLAMQALQSQIASGKYEKPSEISVSSFLELWLEDHVSLLAPKTYKFYDNLVKNYMAEYFLNQPLADLRANHINRYYRHLALTTTLADNTIHHIHKTLRAALNYAVKWDYIDISPIIKATTPKTTKPKLNYWDSDEIIMAINRLNGESIHWHMKMSLLLGLRQGEICALSESSFDFKRHTVSITHTLQYINKQINIKPPKTEKSIRTIPLSPEVERIVMERITQIKENRLLYGTKYNSDWIGYLSVFETGDLISDIYVSKKWTKLMKIINIDPITSKTWDIDNKNYLPPIRFHDLRHSCASWLLANKVDLKSIQEILGHSTFSITSDTYAHLKDSELRAGLTTLSLTALK